MGGDSFCCICALRLKVKREGYTWLNAAAIEVNQVWNYSNEISHKVARPYAGESRWLSAFDLNNLTAGATEFFAHIGSETVQRVNAEFATRRKQFKKAKLRWRVSSGSKRSLGWIPFKAMQLKFKGEYAGRCVVIVNERNTTRACSSCGALTGPAGLDKLVVRRWVCSGCSVTHDREVNAARNIRAAGRCSPSVCGNESSLSSAPSQTSCRCKARISALKAAA